MLLGLLLSLNLVAVVSCVQIQVGGERKIEVKPEMSVIKLGKKDEIPSPDPDTPDRMRDK